MSWCDSENCPYPRDDEHWIGTPVHMFSGYGFYLVYHPECCPLMVDGSACHHDHPTEEQRRRMPQVLKEEEELIERLSRAYRRP